jgi:hypothetical protein
MFGRHSKACHKKLGELIHLRPVYNGLEVNKERIRPEVVEFGSAKQSSLVAKTVNSIPAIISLRLWSII